MAQEQTSFLLKVLQRAEKLAMIEEEKVRSRFYEDERGALRGIPSDSTGSQPGEPSTTPVPEPGAGVLVDHLDSINTSVSSQVAELQTWLHAHPKLQLVLDEAMRKEFEMYEKRIKRTNIIMNALFTILGAVIGLVLPTIITAIVHLLGW